MIIGVNVGIHSHTGATWWQITGNSPWLRAKVMFWVFGINSTFDRMTRKNDLLLSQSQFLALSNPTIPPQTAPPMMPAATARIRWSP